MHLQKVINSDANYEPTLSPETLKPSFPPFCFMDEKDLLDSDKASDASSDNDEARVLWDRRYDRDTLSVRRRQEHVSAGHFISHTPTFHRR